MKRFMKWGALALAVVASPALAQYYPPMVDGSGTITTGGTSQTAFSINQNRSYLMCQNPVAATETLFVNIDATASTAGGSYELAAGGSVTFTPGMVPRGSVSLTAATTGHRFICKQM